MYVYIFVFCMMMPSLQNKKYTTVIMGEERLTEKMQQPQ